MKDAIYLSEDQEWDESDLLVGTVSGTVSLQAGESVERVATGIINSAVPGRYYVIIRTNQLNSILESDYQNNAMASAASCQVDFKELAIGSNAQVDGQGFFKLAAEEGESLLLHLEADGTEKDSTSIWRTIGWQLLPDMIMLPCNRTNLIRKYWFRR